MYAVILLETKRERALFECFSSSHWQQCAALSDGLIAEPTKLVLANGNCARLAQLEKCE